MADDLKRVIKLLEEQNKKLNRIEKSLIKDSQESRESVVIPITKSQKKPTSITSFITFLSKEGFFDTPKTLKEISNELARRGYHYQTSSLTNPIQILLRKRSIGRIIVNGQWAYVKR